MFKKVLVSNKGFMLTQTLISVGISSIIAVGIAAAVASGMDGLSSARNYNIAEEVSIQLSGMLADPDYCASHFKGLNVSGPFPKTINENVVFKDVLADGTLGSLEILKAGKRYQNVVKVKSLELIVENSVGAGRYLGAIAISLEGGSGYSKNFNRTVPIHLATDSLGSIVSCSRMSQPTQGTVVGVWSETCVDFASKGWPSKDACLKDGRWHRVYSNTIAGAVSFGALSNLATAIQEGAQVKVRVADGSLGFTNSYDMCASMSGHEAVPGALACLVGSRPGIPNWALKNAGNPQAVVYYTNGKLVYAAPDAHVYLGLHWYIRY